MPKFTRLLYDSRHSRARGLLSMTNPRNCKFAFTQPLGESPRESTVTAQQARMTV